MFGRLTLLPLFAALSLGACTAGGAVDVGVAQDSITAGASDSGDNGVVFVYSSSGEICTGSVIAPRLVLTAGHCVDARNTYVVGTAAKYDVNDANAALPSVIDVDSFVRHPDYDDSVTPHLHDVAVLKVASDVGSPLPYHAGAPDAAWIGQPIRLVGYGRTSPTSPDYGTRRSVDTEITSYDETELVITNGKQGCPGDSGGPAFMTIDGIETIVGTSTASTADCKTTGYYERIDGDVAFLNAQIAGVMGKAGAEQDTPTKHTQVGGCSASGRGSPVTIIGIFLVLIALLRPGRRRGETTP
ncbi:MAG: trypsin-like serine protease [Polyangia bacterium]